MYILNVLGSPKRNLLRSNTPAVDFSFCAFIALDNSGKKIVSALWEVTVNHDVRDGLKQAINSVTCS
jgi:hypothetical protein